MNLLIIFLLLFQFPLNVKGAPSQSGEVNNSTNDSNTESPENRTTTKYTNTSVTCQATATDINAGTQFDVASMLKFDLKTHFIFLLGVICSTLIFSTVLCFVAICKRCRATDAKTDKASIILAAVKRVHDQADEGQVDEHDPLHLQTPAEVSTNTTAFNNGTEEKTIMGKQQTEEVIEVDYAAINYSLLPKKDDEDLKPQKVDSDYAEIQLNELNKGEDAQTSEVKQKVTQGQEGGMES